MGKIANIVIGIFVGLAGYALRLINRSVGASAAQSPLPFNINVLLTYTSTAFMVIGAVLISYSLLAGAYSIIKGVFGSSRRREDTYKEPRREERYRKSGEERERDREAEEQERPPREEREDRRR